MKKITQYESFALNEAKQQKVDFQLFIDYLTMGSKDFKAAYSGDHEEFNSIKRDMPIAVEAAKKCKIEKTIFVDDKFPQAMGINKTKYPKVFFFRYNIGVDTIYVISSELDLDKIIDKTTIEQ